MGCKVFAYSSEKVTIREIVQVPHEEVYSPPLLCMHKSNEFNDKV